MKYLTALLVSISITAFAQSPIDNQATKQTSALLTNLYQVARNGFMFGHQDDMAYGVGWRGTPGRSDVLESTGSYPAVFGWDIGHQLDHVMNIDSVNFDSMKGWMKEIYRKGGVNTISWHMTNFTTGGNSWDTTPTVVDILPGGQHHALLLEQLDLFALFLNDLKVGRNYIPVIFRPWHEHNGGWFWWGKGNCSEEEYRELFRFTVDYLKNERDIHHLLYAFSPDRSQLPMNEQAEQNYFYGYPGDEYVDIIGLDNYGDVGRSGPLTDKDRTNFTEALKLITRIARDRNKVAALTETGLEGVKISNWYTDVILRPLQENPEEIEIAWVLVWRNANTKHHYASFTGHESVEDFIKFRKDPEVYFLDDLKKPYKKSKILK